MSETDRSSTPEPETVTDTVPAGADDPDPDAMDSGPAEKGAADDDVRIVEPDEVGVIDTAHDDDVVIVEADEVEVLESEHESQARKKEEERAAEKPKSNMGMILVFVVVMFVMFDERLRTGLGDAVGAVLMPVIGFDGAYPVLTVVVAGVVMITLSTLVRHFFIDWIKMATTQNTMKAFQKEFRAARMSQDTKRINELSKEQQKLMGMQTEMTSSQMKPMGYTMLVVIPMFAWLWNFVSGLEYIYFSTPWNLQVNLFTNEGILFGTSLLPHWILLYSVLSIPFGQLLQKALKVWSWRNRVDHVFSDHPDVHEPSD